MKNIKAQEFISDKPHVIVCEGVDDQKFLEEYLRYLSKTAGIDFNVFNIIEMNGVDNITKGMKLFKNYNNYEDMKSFLFIRDADQDVEKAIDSLCGNIREVWKIELDRTGNFKLDEEEKIFGFFIFPGLNEEGNYTNGTLEDLCSEIFSLPEIDSEKLCLLVDNHMKTVEEEIIIKFRTRHKNRLHLLFGSTNEFAGNKIGNAAKKSAFDFSSDKLSNLKNKILQMSAYVFR